MKNISFLVIFVIIFASCNERPNVNSNFNINIEDSIKIERNNIYNKYQIPLPIEIFQIINRNVKFKSDILTPSPNKHKEYSSPENAYYLGIYSADLAYCSLLENGQKTIDYSSICNFFTRKLDIEDVYDKSYVERLRNNINNHDSLIIITNKAYLKSCNLIEDRGMNNIIPFTIYGGWIETIYLAFFSETKNKINVNEYKNFITEKTNIDSLISYLYDVQVESSAYYYNKELKKIIFDLMKLKQLFKENSENNIQNYTKIENKIKELYINTQK